MWFEGFGNTNEELFGFDMLESGRRHAIKSGWGLHRMSRSKAHFDLGPEITAEELETLAWGVFPKRWKTIGSCISTMRFSASFGAGRGFASIAFT